MIPGRVKKTFYAVLAPPLALLALASILELGFDARHWLESKNTVHVTTEQKKILLVGDSILGFLPETFSIASHLRDALEKKAPGRFFLSEISTPALRSDEALFRLGPALENFHPDWVLFMVGKSDHAQTGDGPAVQSPWRISRFYRSLTEDLRTCWAQWKFRWVPGFAEAVEADQATDAIFTAGWKAFSQNDYVQVMNRFEEGLRLRPLYVRALRALHFAYLQSGEFARGLQFFEELERTSKEKRPSPPESNLLRYLAQSLRVRSASIANQVSQIDSVLRMDAEDEMNPYSARTLLWLHQRKGDEPAFAQLFASLGPSAGSTLLDVTKRNLQRAVQQVLESRSHPMVIQYPFEHLAPLQAAVMVPETSANLLFVEPRTWLLEQPSLSQLWQEDLEHLTESGAEVVAQGLADEILSADNARVGAR